MLYREEKQYTKINKNGESLPPNCEEFVECLRNALKIMEDKYPAIVGKE